MTYLLTTLLLILLVPFNAYSALVVGIAGGTGSGKSTIAQRLADAFPGRSVLMSQDNYYKDLSHMPFEERVVQNFDHPDLIDFELFAQQLRQLKNGESVQVPNYSFCQYTREKGTRTVEPAEIIIVDGILLFAVPEIRALCDLKVFVEADDDVRLLRRIERDMRERGRSFESVRNQWLATVMPMHEAFVQPSRRYADVIIPAYQQNDKGIALLIAGL